MKISDFKEVVQNYKIVFFDAYGVLKNYNGLIPGIENTFKFLKEKGIDFYVLTNDASRGPRKLAEKYNQHGIKEITPEKIISSGMLAREYLQYKVKSGTVAFLGSEGSREYLERIGLHTISIRDLDIDHIADVTAMVFMDDEGFDWQRDINKVMNLLRRRNIPAIIANTDLSYPVSGGKVAIAIGGIANMVESILGKRFLRFGKPDAQMFIFAYEHSVDNGQIHKSDILMVGDTLYTDIIGGNKFGIHTALVLTGNTLAKTAKQKIRSKGIIPDYICESAVIKY